MWCWKERKGEERKENKNVDYEKKKREAMCICQYLNTKRCCARCGKVGMKRMKNKNSE